MNKKAKLECKPTQMKLCGVKECQTCFSRSFAIHEKAQYWSEKNVEKPWMVFKCTNKKYILDCECGHEFEISPNNVVNGKECPYCANKKLCENNECENCFNKSFAIHEKAQYWSNKNKSKPRQVFKSSGNKYIFDCTCGHEFSKVLYSIISGGWCPYCSNKKLCDNIDCEYCFNNSFASNEKSQYWSKKNKLTPRQILKSSGKKYIFDCTCGHEIIKILRDISRESWCPYCCIQVQQLCEDNNCVNCFNRSFASNDKSKYWSKKNITIPRNVAKSSNSFYLFNCQCGHEINKKLSEVSSGSWCGFCEKKKLCKNKDCYVCFNNSFASHEKVIYWSKKNKLTPRQVFKSSNKKFFFECNNKHEINIALNDVSSGYWCALCKNKTEAKLNDWFKTNFEFEVKLQKKFDWCKNLDTNRYFPFDFYISSLKVIIELDGRQHFKQVSNWNTPEHTMKRDVYKMKLALEHGITVIRLLQEDVFEDKNNWEELLKEHLREYENPEVIYLENGQEYEAHKETMDKLLEEMKDEEIEDEED